jgi:PAS domain S-box-containing protein
MFPLFYTRAKRGTFLAISFSWGQRPLRLRNPGVLLENLHIEGCVSDTKSSETAQGLGTARRKDPLTLLQQSEQMVTALLESASQAILSVDRSGRIVLANPKTEEMFGYSREELLGAGIEILLPESRRATHGRERDEYFARPRTRPMGIGMDLAGRRRDGTEFPVEVSLSYVKTEEGVFGIAFVNDISVRKRLEEQLMQAQKMKPWAGLPAASRTISIICSPSSTDTTA